MRNDEKYSSQVSHGIVAVARFSCKHEPWRLFFDHRKFLPTITSAHFIFTYVYNNFTNLYRGMIAGRMNCV